MNERVDVLLILWVFVYLLLIFEGGFLCFVRTSFNKVVLWGECQALWVLCPL